MARFVCPYRPMLLLMTVLAISSLTDALRAQGAPGPAPVVPARSTRPLDAVMTDFGASMDQFRPLIAGIVVTDPAQRAAIAPKAIPLLKRLQSLQMEFSTTGGDGAAISADIGSQFQQFLLAFGDADAIAQNQAQASSRNPTMVATAGRDLLFVHWIQQPNEADQRRLLDSAQAMAKQSPADLQLCRTLVQMSQFGAATPEIRQRATAVAAGMQTPISPQLQDDLATEQKIHSFQGKPQVITGKTVDGKPFTTADWKGRVVMVDFWATWCPLCIAELPRVKKAYADLHSKGLEVLGVCNDYDVKTMTDFAATNGMPWPQLLDRTAAAAQDWNPTTLGFGIDAIPRMFLIDKNGILQSVDVTGDYEAQISKLLAQ